MATVSLPGSKQVARQSLPRAPSAAKPVVPGMAQAVAAEVVDAEIVEADDGSLAGLAQRRKDESLASQQVQLVSIPADALDRLETDLDLFRMRLAMQDAKLDPTVLDNLDHIIGEISAVRGKIV